MTLNSMQATRDSGYLPTLEEQRGQADHTEWFYDTFDASKLDQGAEDVQAMGLDIEEQGARHQAAMQDMQREQIYGLLGVATGEEMGAGQMGLQSSLQRQGQAVQSAAAQAAPRGTIAAQRGANFAQSRLNAASTGLNQQAAMQDQYAAQQMLGAQIGQFGQQAQQYANTGADMTGAGLAKQAEEGDRSPWGRISNLFG